MDCIEEIECIERARAGDMQAFRRLYDRYLPRVARHVTRLIGPDGEVEDVVQNVFVEVYRSLERFRGDSKFSTWLYQVTWNVSMTHLRGQQDVTFVDLTALRQFAAHDEAWSKLRARDKLRTLYAALERLNDDYRESFVLYEIEGMTLREIAEMTDTSINTIASRVRRARDQIRELLERLEKSSTGPRREVQR
jgi:RNA polymerase sigma-70 factor (ECF subfamily)